LAQGINGNTVFTNTTDAPVEPVLANPDRKAVQTHAEVRVGIDTAEHLRVIPRACSGGSTRIDRQTCWAAVAPGRRRGTKTPACLERLTRRRDNPCRSRDGRTVLSSDVTRSPYRRHQHYRRSGEPVLANADMKAVQTHAEVRVGIDTAEHHRVIPRARSGGSTRIDRQMCWAALLPDGDEAYQVPDQVRLTSLHGVVPLKGPMLTW